MRVSTFKLSLLPIILYHLLVILCAATATFMDSCHDCHDRFLYGRYRSPSMFIHMHDEDCMITRPEDCLIPQFQCFRNARCIPRRCLCNGILDCSDGSDEWRCFSPTTTTTVSTTTSRMYSESTEHTSSYSITTSTMLQDNDEKTTRGAFPESRANTSPRSTSASMIYAHSEPNNVLSSSTTPKITFPPHSESNTLFSSTTSTIIPNSESNTLFSSTTSTIIPNSESITTTSSSTTAKTMIPDTASKTAPTLSPYTMKIESESNTTASSFTTSTMIPESESKTAPSSSRTSTMIPDNESNTVTSSPTRTKTMHSVSEENSSSSTFAADNTMVPESVEKTVPSTTNTIFPESSEMPSCPDSYCMQNAECIVVKGHYRCKCHSSFIGEHCDIKLGSEQGSHQFTVAIAISMTLVILCLAAMSVCIYRYKRLSSWKSRDMTSRTLSQMTLASNSVE